MIHAYAAHTPGGRLEPFAYDPGPLGAHDVEIRVTACGVCHSDVSMWKGDWGMSQYPFVPGHEVVGTVAARGEHVTHLEVGDTVGLGWTATSCGHCTPCTGGDQQLCRTAEGTIVGRHGGFADRVRCNATWAIRLPDGVAARDAGPLFCGGITVFTPFLALGIKPTDRVGVVGIGGLGHLALQFAAAWGCHVTAFTSTAAKADEARSFGAHEVVDSRSSEAIRALDGSLDLILSTVNVPLDWSAYLSALGPKGRLHVVGAVPEPIPVQAFQLIGQQRSVSGSPTGSPSGLATMLDFCARHGIQAQTEHFALSECNEAFAHLESGNARYRVVLDVD